MEAYELTYITGYGGHLISFNSEEEKRVQMNNR